jgi:hypothetical protein
VVEPGVSDTARSFEFYEKSGFHAERVTATFAALLGGASYPFLSQTPQVSLEKPPANIRLIVSDLAPWIERVRTQAWPITSEPADPRYGLLDFTMLDPDGHELPFATPSNG